MTSDKEYEIRFGVVMALDYFADENHAKEAFGYFDRITNEGYYAENITYSPVCYPGNKFPDTPEPLFFFHRCHTCYKGFYYNFFIVIFRPIVQIQPPFAL